MKLKLIWTHQSNTDEIIAARHYLLFVVFISAPLPMKAKLRI
jgi:hypothetical protein